MKVEDFKKIELESKEYVTYYHEFVSVNMMEAYEPFLAICKDFIEKNQIDIKELVDKANVYAMHKSVLINYFKGKVCDRDEEIIVPEAEFEKKKFLESLEKIMGELSAIAPIFILLNKINLAGSSTLDFLLRLSKEECHLKRVKILCISNEFGNVASYTKDRYESFRKFCEKEKVVYDWPYNIKDRVTETELSFVFKAEETEEYCNQIKMMFNTTAYEQAMYYLGIIYQKIELEKLDVPAYFRIHMLCYYIWLNIFKMNASYALLVCDSLKQVECDGELEYVKEYEYNYLIANANMYNGNEEDSKRAAEKCIEIARAQKDDFRLFKGELLYNMTELSGWKEIWICEKEIKVSDHLLESCKKYRYFNHLAHIYVYCYDNDFHLYRVIEDLQETIPHVLLGIRMAEELQNDQFLIEAYRKNVMTASYNGLFAASSYFYNKSLLVAKKTNNKVEEANIYNGLGYNSSASDHFEEAHEYFCKALRIYYTHKRSDYIMETLYNMGMNAILAEDYENALRYLLVVLDILQELRNNSIRVCNISKIFGLVALAAFRKGNFYEAQFYQNKAKQFLEFILNYDEDEFYNYLWDDDMFLYYLVSGLIALKEGKYEDAIGNYERAKVFVEKFNGSSFFNYPQFIISYAETYKAMGNTEKYYDLLLEGRERCNLMGNFARVKQFDEMLEGIEVTPMKLTMDLQGDVTVEEIMEFVRVEVIEIEANNKKKDIRFFRTFQDLANHPAEDIEVYAFNLISSFKNNFNLDHVIFISCEGEQNEIKYSDIKYEIGEENIQKIVDYFRKNPSGFAISQLSNNYFEYEKLLSIFRESKIFSFVGVPMLKNNTLLGVFIAFIQIHESWNSSVSRDSMGENELEIFSYIFAQIIDALDKYKMNQMLRKQAETDRLTGTYNRNMYYDRMNRAICAAAKKNQGIDVAILYADLDNFKVYNDNFGHYVGDAILIEFANVFTEASRGKGEVIRFGGDEFLIILYTVEEEQVKKVVDDIYGAIHKTKGFVDIVKKYTNKEVVIEEEHRASCSIGVAMGRDVRDMAALTEIRKRADAALYDVKRNGRGYAKFAGS